MPIAAPALPDRTRRDPLFSLADLAAGGDRVAAVDGRGTAVSYAELAERAGGLGRRLGGGSTPVRRLVLVEGANRLDSLVAHLAALTHGHVVLLVAPGQADGEVAKTYRPDVVVSADGSLTERAAGSAHALHEDLALLLSTSGSTGSPKLVRLSREGVRANAAAIATYLGLAPDDRAITSLPMHYCYGLSVVHSHLVAGAGVVLSDLSVVDECFWRTVADQRVTSFAGVPYTFDLLDRSGFADRSLPGLRRVTQAGGRLAPESVRRFAEIGRRRGFDLFVMYGATEATARMAWLPPDLATDHPDAIGVPVPGGSLRVEPVDELPAGTGELVYTGPNVMLGYATGPGDLAAGREVTELRTGDAAELRDGLFHVRGRLDRQVKVFGLRLDLDGLTARLDRDLPGTPVLLHGSTDRLFAFVPHLRQAERVHARLRELTGLPHSAVRVERLTEVPRTASGKPDLKVLDRYVEGLAGGGLDTPLVPRGGSTTEGETTEGETTEGETTEGGGSTTEDPREAVRADYAAVLGRPAGPADTFVSLGGDSLSYVELSTRLEGRLPGGLPPGWHLLTIEELGRAAAESAARPRGGLIRAETATVLRALAIVAIVLAHVDRLHVMGGAHILLAVAGFNLARFQLAGATRERRVAALAAGVAVIAVPTFLWIAANGLLLGTYGPSTATFTHEFVAGDEWTKQWRYWFLEVLVWCTALTGLLFVRPAIDRLERRRPWEFALALVLVLLVIRFAGAGLVADMERYALVGVAWLFALGWAATRADTVRRRLVLTGSLLAGVTMFFGDPGRELVVAGGIAALIWLPTLPVPRLAAPALRVLASSSFFVYLTHWLVYRPIEDAGHPWLALLASFVLGIGIWAMSRSALRRLAARVTRATMAVLTRPRQTVPAAA